jgi:hypothetical protein
VWAFVNSTTYPGTFLSSQSRTLREVLRSVSSFFGRNVLAALVPDCRLSFFTHQNPKWHILSISCQFFVPVSNLRAGELRPLSHRAVTASALRFCPFSRNMGAHFGTKTDIFILVDGDSMNLSPTERKSNIISPQ